MQPSFAGLKIFLCFVRMRLLVKQLSLLHKNYTTDWRIFVTFLQKPNVNCSVEFIIVSLCNNASFLLSTFHPEFQSQTSLPSA